MATDRYSDNHKVVVGGASGTKEWELQADTIKHSAASDFYVYTENAYYTANSGATFSCNGTKFSYTDESRIDFYQNLIVNSGANIIFGDGSDLKMSDTSKIYGKEFDIWAGVGTTTGTLTISADEGHNPKIVLSQSGNSITETAGLWQVSADTALITADSFTVAVASRSVTLSSSSASLIPSLEDSTADTTTLTLRGAAKHQDSSMTGTGISYFVMSLPDSIPNGASIQSIGLRVKSTDGGAAITLGIKEIDLVDGSPDADIVTDATFGIGAPGEELITRNISVPNINKTRSAYTIWIQIMSTGDATIYILGTRITYSTTKLDNNQ